jgi:hypothetical protein
MAPGYPGYRIAGYSPATAWAMLTNLLWALAEPATGD